MEYINNPYFLLALTFVVYGLAQIIQRRTHSSLFNPILVTITLIILFLTANDISYDTYSRYGSYIEFWLKPAVVALAVYSTKSCRPCGNSCSRLCCRHLVAACRA